MFRRSTFVAVVALFVPSAAEANVHIWHIEELYSNGAGDLQFFEIDTNTTGQNIFKSGGNDSRFISKTTGGATHATFLVPNDLPNYTLINGHRKVLFGTSSLAGVASVTPDFVFPNSFLLPGGGRLEFFSPLWGLIHAVNYPALPGGALSYDSHEDDFGLNTPTNFANVTGAIPPPVLVGDYNGDDVVNAADYTLWRDTLGSTANLSADGNGNHVIDAGDYQAWRAAFGATSGSGAAAEVPEPMGAVLMIAGFWGILAARRRK